MSELPAQFLTRMQQLLGEEYQSFLESLFSTPITGLRVNTLKITTEAFGKLASFQLQPVPWCQAGYIAQESQRPGKHPYHAAGLYYLQEPSAMAVAEALDPQPGERVLDLAAAPGGKTTHIAALMKGEGVIVANEVHPRRVWELAQNLERWGARNVIIINESPQRLVGIFPDAFDRVLLDAPCSGEGMFRRSKTARSEWSPSLVASSARRQRIILDEAARMVRPGGVCYTPPAHLRQRRMKE